MSKRQHWPKITLLGVLCLVGSSSKAQEPSVAAIFSERIDVNIVEVLVRVTDEEGNPVAGLSPEEFRIFEDGKPVQLTNFMAVEDRQVVQQLVADPTKEAPTETDSGLLDLNAPASPPEENLVSIADSPEAAEPLYLSVFIDNTTLQQRNRKKALAGVQEFFEESLAPDDNVLIATLDDQYRIVQTFTSDPAELKEALAGLKKASSQGDQKEAILRNMVRDLQAEVITPETASYKAHSSRVQVDQYARILQIQVRQCIGALSYLMSTLAGLPGQRAMLYVGEGLPMRPAEGLIHAQYNKFSGGADLDPPEVRTTDFELTREFEEFVAHAQTSGIEFWAIDAAGKRAGYGGGAGFSMGERDSALLSGTQMAWNHRLDILEARNVQSTLQLAAGDTGGEVMVNNRDYSQFLNRMRTSLDNFYSIGYSAPHGKEGGLHKIRVEVDRPGLKAHFQRGYRDKTWNQRLTDAVISELLLDVGDNPLEVQISAGEPKIEGNKAEVEVTVLVPLHRLTLVPQDDGFVGSASMVLLTRDEFGNTSTPRTVPMEIHIPAASLQGNGPGMAEAKVDLVVGAGQGAIGVGVRDDLADTVSTTTTPVTLQENPG